MLATSSSDAGVQAIVRSYVGPLPNEWLISCKRPVRTYGPLLPLGASDAGGATHSAAFVGCISGLGSNPLLKPAGVVSSVLEAG